MPQPDHISKLGVPDRSELDEDLQQVFVKCVDKLGYVPNVLAAYSLRPQRLRNFMSIYNEIMLSPSGLSKLEREMVAVVVSSPHRAEAFEAARFCIDTLKETVPIWKRERWADGDDWGQCAHDVRPVSASAPVPAER